MVIHGDNLNGVSFFDKGVKTESIVLS